MKKSITIIASALFTLLFSVLVYGAPPIPNQYYGEVIVNGKVSPDGVSVEAKINGVTYASILTSGGKYGYNQGFYVPSDVPETSEIEGGVNGETIEFYLNGVKSGSSVFQNGGIIELSLEGFGVSVEEPQEPDDSTENPSVSQPESQSSSGSGGGVPPKETEDDDEDSTKNSDDESNQDDKEDSKEEDTEEGLRVTSLESSDKPPAAPNDNSKESDEKGFGGITGAAINTKSVGFSGIVVTFLVVLTGLIIYFKVQKKSKN